MLRGPADTSKSADIPLQMEANREGAEYNIKFRLNMQEPRNIAWPEGLHLQHIEFTSTPIVPQ